MLQNNMMTSSASLLFTDPIEYCVRQPVFQLIFTLFGVCQLMRGLSALRLFWTPGNRWLFFHAHIPDGSLMRNFTIDILSDGCFQSSFGLAAGIATNASSRLQNRPIVDGFIIRSDCFGQSAADGGFVITGSVDGVAWEPVAASDQRWAPQGLRFLTHSSPCAPSISVDLRPPWPWA